MTNQILNTPIIMDLTGEDDLGALIREAKDWAIMHGVSMRSKDNFSEDAVQIAPFTLFPSAVPRDEFKKVVDLQIIFNELIHLVAHNRQFLMDCLKDTVQVDEFTKELFSIYKTIIDEGISQVGIILFTIFQLC